MVPSKILRLIISKNHKIKLKNFSWSKNFELKVFSITFYDGRDKYNLGTIFKAGYNIGNCLLTAHYVSTILENSLICTGVVEILKGTKNSPNGDHVWLEYEDYIIDTTLMIFLPKNHEYAKFYHREATICPNFSSDDLSYQDDMYQRRNHITEYYTDLYKTQ